MKHLILFLVVICAYFTSGQELPSLNNYEPSTYQAGNQNWMISESNDHFIYVANNKGLLEYNGSQWTLYKTPNESIMRSVKTQGDRIYTGCYMDFGYWLRDSTGTLKYTSIIQESNFKLQEDEQFWNIIVKEDYVLFQSLSHVYSYNKENGQVTQIAEQVEINKFFEVGDSYYYHVLGVGLFQVIDGKSELQGAVDFFKNETVVLVYEFDSKVYIVTQYADIYEYHDGVVEKTASSKFDEQITVYSASLLSDSTLMLGTISHGIISMSLDGKVNYAMDQSDGLLNNTCLYVFEDSAKNVWLALDNGLSSINIESPYRMFHDKDGELGTIYASFQDDDYLYLGTNQGLFYKEKLSDNFVFIEGTQGQVWSIDKVGDSVLCSHHLGVFEIKKSEADYIKGTNGAWEVLSIPDYDDLILVGTYKGLQVLEFSANEWTFKNNIEGFKISSKDVVVQDDYVYVNHEYKGVFQLKIDENYSKLVESQKINELGKGIGSDITVYNDRIFFSKRDAIYIKEKSDEKFLKNEGLSKLVSKNKYTSGTFIKNDGYLWIFNKEGIQKINIEVINGSYDIESIPLTFELRREKIGYENLTKVGSKLYLIGTSYGYTTVDEGYKYSRDHQVYINTIKKYDKNNAIALDLKEPIEIPYSNNVTEIGFSTPYYNTLSNIEYKYRLIGQYDEWSNWTKLNDIRFKNLSYGDYIFEVKSRVNSVVSQNTAQQEFSIARPYYLTTGAILLYVVLLALLIIGLNLAYIWYFKRQREYALQKQQKELELNNLTIEKNLVELRNAKLRSDIEHRNRELAISTMAMIKKNETLNELKSELENLPKTKESKSLKKMLDKNLNSKQDWLTFEEAFNNADKDFFKKIKELHPSLSSGDLRLCVYLRLNLSSKEIAPLLNISPRSVEIKRYRLRKKLALSREESLTSYIVEI
ncbi:YXYXY domain-containing protein [Nonlabens dokdonensis]|uniref:YXYXY domain-containing protein n=2 Tax=Nonlabens dokdonensis TaxID=328515 RepID=A0ABX5PXS1_9FLAO|nr:triple tyrosine motif-containing protein [Nonlabens dokdonensis]AGC77480.1 putative periplasmic ligand-binding sensor protein [Nonlabens dokdonensis DSW-6]PZX39960.1 YXYXY domain-containing protein [Nonlabens dokdonensis]